MQTKYGVIEDTQEPIDGAVFEKQIKTSIDSFTALMNRLYRKPCTSSGDGCVLFWEGNKHVGTYLPMKGRGVFGGSRIGRDNPWRKTEGAVKNPVDLSVLQDDAI